MGGDEKLARLGLEQFIAFLDGGAAREERVRQLVNTREAAGAGYLALGRFGEGIADLSRAIDMDPRLPTAAIRTVTPRSSARGLQHAAWPRRNRQ
jgi:hypothetical protein